MVKIHAHKYINQPPYDDDDDDDALVEKPNTEINGGVFSFFQKKKKKKAQNRMWFGLVTQNTRMENGLISEPVQRTRCPLTGDDLLF